MWQAFSNPAPCPLQTEVDFCGAIKMFLAAQMPNEQMPQPFAAPQGLAFCGGNEPSNHLCRLFAVKWETVGSLWLLTLQPPPTSPQEPPQLQGSNPVGRGPWAPHLRQGPSLSVHLQVWRWKLPPACTGHLGPRCSSEKSIGPIMLPHLTCSWIWL